MNRITFEPEHQTRTLDTCGIYVDGRRVGTERTGHRWNKPMSVEYWMDIHFNTKTDAEAFIKNNNLKNTSIYDECYGDGYFLSTSNDNEILVIVDNAIKG